MLLRQPRIESIKELKNFHYIQPIQIHYTQNETPRVWEAIISHDSVSILLWHEEREAFVIVKQFRPAVLNANKKDGMTYELCAGIVDKNASDAQIAKEEVLEECGYDIDVNTLQKVSSFFTNVGVSGAKQTLYYGVVNESMRVSNGGGLIEEDIEVVYIPLSEVKEFMFDESYQKTPGMMMAFYWFLDNVSV